ncbi:MAG: DUF1552 domain-containing protein [Polyangiaceae bacterium]
MSASRWGRRAFLRRIGLGAAALPFVPWLDVHADTEAPPRRIIFFFSSNGTIRESWLPTVKEGGLELGPILSPLERHKQRLLVVDGLTHKVVLEKGDRSGHSAGMNTALTGRKAHQTDKVKAPLRSLATGISVDQYLGSRIGKETKLRTIELGVAVQPFSEDTACLSYANPLSPMYPENSPYSAFGRLFKGYTDPVAAVGPTPEELVRKADRKRVLDAVTKDLAAVRGAVPASDQQKIDAHLDAVSALEHSLVTGVGAAAPQCRKPDLGAPMDLWDNANIPKLAKLQIDLAVTALACDLTRIATVQFGTAGSGHRFLWLGKEFENDPALPAGDGATGFHAIAHHDAEPAARAKLVRIHTWYAEQLAYLLDKLAAIPEAGGTMLDNTVVAWVNELGSGGLHTHDDLPYLIAGNARGYFKPNQLVALPGEPHNRLLLSLCHAMGVMDEEFGDPDYCKAGPLTGVTA